MNAICKNVSTTAWPTSSVYGTDEAAVAHLATTFSSCSLSCQGTRGDASVAIEFREGGVGLSNSVAMYGPTQCHMNSPEVEVPVTHESIIPCCPPRARWTACGKSAFIALRLDQSIF